MCIRDSYNPSKVILGHIHKKTGMGKVLYPGSPCGMDINETGKRSFFILDLNDLSITEKTVDTEYIFFNETLIALPTFNEFDYTRNKIKEIVKGFNLSKDEISKARIRLKVKGYTSDKKKLAVSYTHLDVYKRQGQGYLNYWCWWFNRLRNL